MSVDDALVAQTRVPTSPEVLQTLPARLLLDQYLEIDLELPVRPHGSKVAGSKRQAVLGSGCADEGVIHGPACDGALGE